MELALSAYALGSNSAQRHVAETAVGGSGLGSEITQSLPLSEDYLLWGQRAVVGEELTEAAENQPPFPHPPEPSPPPPPSPNPPEPSPPIIVLHFLDGDTTILQGGPRMEGPPLILHMLVSTFSALGMLILACSLRLQNRPHHHHRLRPPVVEARPVLQAYGMVPTNADEIELGDEPQRAPHAEEGGDGGERGDGGTSAATAEPAMVVVVPARDWSPRRTMAFTELRAELPVVAGERVGEPVAPPAEPAQAAV